MNNNIDFTERELTLLSDGLLTMIENAGQAKRLLCDSDSQKVIDKYVKELQALNNKICTRGAN